MGPQRKVPSAVTTGAGRGSGAGKADVLAAWAEGLGSRREGMRGRGCLRFVFYGRVSTEDWQDPVTSSARQLALQLPGGK